MSNCICRGGIRLSCPDHGATAAKLLDEASGRHARAGYTAPEQAPTAGDKLRELIATRPLQPNLLELVRWWETSAELLPEVLAFDGRLAAARAAAKAYTALVDDLGAAADDGDPRVMALAGAIGKAQADLWIALGLDLNEEHARLIADIESRCAVCGWILPDPIRGTAGVMCLPGNCAQRPRPERLYAPERAAREAEEAKEIRERALRNGMPPSGRWA